MLNMIQLNRRLNMPVNQNETNLQAITVTIAHLEKQEDKDEELLKKLKYERQSILKQMNVI
jgi:hypothetical protein